MSFVSKVSMAVCLAMALWGCGSGKTPGTADAGTKSDAGSQADAGSCPTAQSCGTICCSTGQVCGSNGQCETPTTCPADKVCGTECCTTAQTCSAGTCVVNTTGACDPIQLTGCTAPDACYWSSKTGEACKPAGSAALGDACSATTDCAPGAICMSDGAGGGICIALCDPNGTGICTATEICQAYKGRGYCRTPPACNPFAQTGCTGADACYWDDAAFDYACGPAGTTIPGAPCTVDSDCTPGNGCYGATAGACVAYCDPAAATSTCPAGITCQDFGDGTGACY